MICDEDGACVETGGGELLTIAEVEGEPPTVPEGWPDILM
jgi:hypothetical protein|tara:strand:+ start:10140 stop:10259 length:120 start_codon:yes stop_codon:yes gene_type:complete